LPLRDLRIDHSRVAQLEPLSGMPLEVLDCNSSGITDLAPPRGAGVRRGLRHRSRVRRKRSEPRIKPSCRFE
jgi:hypothetical protein